MAKGKNHIPPAPKVRAGKQPMPHPDHQAACPMKMGGRPKGA